MAVDVPVALLGYGNVGGAVARMLAESADDIERATGHRLRIVRALVRDPERERAHLPESGVLTTDFASIRVSCVVRAADVERAVQAVHDRFGLADAT